MFKDIAKILIGIFLSDISVLIWLIAGDHLPINFFGLEWGFAPIMIFVLVDFVILILLTYFAWFRKPKKEKKGKEASSSNQEKLLDTEEE